MSFPHAEGLTERAKALRKEQTPWERKLWYEFLRGHPIRFQRQKPIGNAVVDFYCPAAKLVVELDGSQHYEPENQAKDAARTAALEHYGLTVLRFSNQDVTDHFTAVCETIHRAVMPPSEEGGGPQGRRE